MGQKEKLIKKLLSKPKNFTFSEAESLLAYFDYVRSNKGKTSGSRIMSIVRSMLQYCCINHIREKNY